MLVKSLLTFPALLLGALFCADVAAGARRFVKAPQLPAEWQDVGVAAQTDAFQVLLSIKPAAADAHERIKETALRISNPDDGANYGRHLSMAQVNDLRAPDPEALDRVISYFRDREIEVHIRGGNGDTVLAKGTVANFERAFSTTLRTVQLQSSHSMGEVVTKIQANDFVIPGEISDVVTSVFGMHGLPLPRRRAPELGPAANVTPTILRQVYNISGVNPSGSTENRQAVAEFQGQFFRNEDLTAFFKEYVPSSTNTSDSKIYKVVGDPDPQNQRSGIEAALDVQYIMGVATGVLTEFWGFQDMDFCSDLKTFTAKILSTENPPSVFSISYGWQGDLSRICNVALVPDIENAFASIAARGISIIISSGDSGSGQTEVDSDTCDSITSGVQYTGESTKLPALASSSCCHQAQSNGDAGFSYVKGGFFQKGQCYGFKSISNGTIKNSKSTSGIVPSYYKLFPSWPASSPWVTAVGSTRFIDQDSSGKSGEMATDQFGSGGGFSFEFNRSDAMWQKSFVAEYLQKDANDLPPQTSWSQNGRATPDVSALGEGFQVIANDKTVSVGGTSASAPTFAAIISLINEARMTAGKPVLGYLNPFIYKNVDAFRDVTIGSNKIGRGGVAWKYGWNCTEGWDPATGHGTPNFQRLLKAALAA